MAERDVPRCPFPAAMCKAVDLPSFFASIRISAGDTFSRSANASRDSLRSSSSPTRAKKIRSSISSSESFGAMIGIGGEVDEREPHKILSWGEGTVWFSLPRISRTVETQREFLS